MNPSIVAFMGIDPSDDTVAARLGGRTHRRMRALPAVVEAVPAFGEPDCRKLLVLMGNGAPPGPGRLLGNLPNFAQNWIRNIAGDSQGDVLPVLPAGAAVTAARVEFKNVAFWHRDSESEVLPGVFQRAGLAPEDYRIFISYIRPRASGYKSHSISWL